jgi:S1-C subfamily serine protease
MKISEIIEQNKKSIILIDVLIPGEGGKNKLSIRGTGFIISKDGKFVTCSHVYNQIPENERQYLGVKVPERTDEKGITFYKRYNVKLLDIDKENDVALMEVVSQGDVEFEPIKGFGDSESVKEGDEVMFLGYPLALELIKMKFGITISANKCIISSTKRRGFDGSLHFFIVDTHINNGSSGSPLFLIDTGKIVGMASGKISAKIPAPKGGQIDIPANMGICRPANHIVDLINKNK